MSIRVVCAMIYDGMVVGGVYGISMTMYELDRDQIIVYCIIKKFKLEGVMSTIDFQLLSQY